MDSNLRDFKIEGKTDLKYHYEVILRFLLEYYYGQQFL